LLATAREINRQTIRHEGTLMRVAKFGPVVTAALGSSTSPRRLGSSKHRDAALVSSAIKRLKTANRYTVTVAVGPDDDQITYHRKVTLRKVKSIARIHTQLHC
jgi:hypothetical protein